MNHIIWVVLTSNDILIYEIELINDMQRLNVELRLNTIALEYALKSTMNERLDANKVLKIEIDNMPQDK